MFTGLVQAVGEVVRLEPGGAGTEIDVSSPAFLAARAVGGGANGGVRDGRGDSVGVSGCCLTLVADPVEVGGVLRFVAVPETVGVTTLGGLGVGSRVNLEGAVTASTLMGGHVVQGHVDGVGRVTRVVRPGDRAESGGDGWRVRVGLDAGLMRWMMPKGSVCLDGVSLTIAALDVGDGADDSSGGWIEVALIPETLEKTTLRDLETGDRVNVEGDVMVKTVVAAVERYLGASAVGRPAVRGGER